MKYLEKRIPPPIVMLISAGLIWIIAKETATIAISLDIKIGLALTSFSLGCLVDLSSVFWFRKHKTTINPLKPEATKSLVTDGPYKISRNPMYVGLVLFLLSWVVYFAAPGSLTVVIGFIVYITYFQIKPEERMLEQVFGEQYRTYKESVRRWL